MRQSCGIASIRCSHRFVPCRLRPAFTIFLIVTWTGCSVWKWCSTGARMRRSTRFFAPDCAATATGTVPGWAIVSLDGPWRLPDP